MSFLTPILEGFIRKPFAVVAMMRSQTDPGLWLGVSRKNDPNDWGLPGGKVEPDETPMQAIHREVMEETGIKIISCARLCDDETGGGLVRCFIVDEWLRVSSPAEGEGQFGWQTEDVLSSGTFGDFNRRRFDEVRRIVEIGIKKDK